MRLKTVGAVSALALFAGLSTVALAQGPGGGQERERLQAPGQQLSPGQQMSPGQQRGAPGGQMAPAQKQRGERPAAAERRQGQAQKQRDRTEKQQAEQPERKQMRGAEQPDRKGRKAEEPTRKKQQRAEEPAREQRQKAEEPRRKDRQQAEQPQRKGQERAERKERPQVSEQQRVTARERFRESGAIDRARVASVDFNISVGTRVPRDRIRLAAVPAVIVQAVPAYRGYDYFVVRDEVVIVEPSTYVIVDVIRLDGSSGRTAQAEGRLTLTGDQRHFVLRHIDLQPGIRLGIGGISIGMSVPQSVELRSFPQAVIEDVPELEGYRYFVFEQDVAIVDPDQRQVVLTISE